MVKFTMKRGKVVSVSDRQHKWLHARLNEGDHAGDHTHIEDPSNPSRHSVETVRRKAHKSPRTHDNPGPPKDRGDTWTRLFGPS